MKVLHRDRKELNNLLRKMMKERHYLHLKQVSEEHDNS